MRGFLSLFDVIQLFLLRPDSGLRMRHFELSAPSLHPHYRNFLTTTSGTDFLRQTFFRPMGTVTAFKDIGLPSSTRPRGISRQSFLVYLLDLRIRVTVTFLDFVTLSPLILRIRLGIKFLFVRLRFRYPFFSPAPHGTNLGSRFRVRRQLRPDGLSP